MNRTGRGGHSSAFAPQVAEGGGELHLPNRGAGRVSPAHQSESVPRQHGNSRVRPTPRSTSAPSSADSPGGFGAVPNPPFGGPVFYLDIRGNEPSLGRNPALQLAGVTVGNLIFHCFYLFRFRSSARTVGRNIRTAPARGPKTTAKERRRVFIFWLGDCRFGQCY